MPGVYANPHTSKLSTASILRSIDSKLDRVLSCGFYADVIQCFKEAKPSVYLENIIPYAQDACYQNSNSGLEDEMAKQHRLRVIIGMDEDNQPIIKQIAATSETALADAAIRAVIKSGRITEFLPELVQHFKSTPESEVRPKTLLREYVESWRKTYKQGLSPTTDVFYDSKQSVILNRFGDKCIEDIKPDDVQCFLNDRASACSKKTVKDDLAFLRMVLDAAVNDEIIPKNPAKDSRIYNPAQEGEGTIALTRDQIKGIQDAIPTLEDDRERCLIALLAYTSMRREEILALKWESIDFDVNTIHINQALVYPNSIPTLKQTKTKSSKRAFPMGETLRSILWACKRDVGFVICDDEGKPFTLYGYQQLWDSLGKHINLYGMTSRNFRTTFATMALASGVDIRTTQALMGHSDPKMTLSVYAKVEQSVLPKAVTTIAKFLGE